MKDYLRKNMFVVVILGITVILAGVAVYTAIRLYQSRNVALNAPSSRPRAQQASATPTTYTKTQTVILPKFTAQQCPWGQGDNMSRESGRARARISNSQNFALENCTLDSGTVKTQRLPSSYLYDDTLLIMIDNKVLAGTNTIVNALGGIGRTFNWSTVRNTDQNSQMTNTRIICIGDTCEAPYTFHHERGDKSPLVNISLSKENLQTLLDASTQTHTFSAMVIGDNDQSTDCKLHEDLILTLNYTCQSDIVACEEVVFSIATPTPTPTAPPVACNQSCDEDSDCAGTNECVGNVCRNPQCDTETDCTCSGSTPTPTPTVTPTATPTTGPTSTPASCNNTCSQNSDCSSGLVCVGNQCRNSSCSNETDCTCAVATSTPHGTSTPEPSLPEAGISTPTLIGGIAGILLILGALLLAL